MTLGMLKWLRLFVPAALIIVYWVVLRYLVSGVVLELPDFSKTPYLVAVIIPAALYYITPLRGLINKGSHKRINENLRTGMVEIVGYPDDNIKYKWENLRSLFYKLIDNDNTLSVKASLAYFNGLLWTSFADSAAIAAGYTLLSIALYYFNVQNSFLAIVTFIVIFIVSYCGNRITERRHIEIGNEQLEHMKFEHKDAIERRLIELDK